MKSIPVEQWAKPKTRPSRKEIILNSIQNSMCKVVPAEDQDGNLCLLGIEFHGDLARTPNLKNRKIPGKVFTNPEVEGRLIAMDRHFSAAANRISTKFNFGDKEIFILLLCGNRPREFDVDSCMVTIRDWLEPSTKIVGKRVRDRGWGIGVINDDAQARGLALKWSDLGIDNDFTYIEIMLRCDVVERVVGFIESTSRRALLMGAK